MAPREGGGRGGLALRRLGLGLSSEGAGDGGTTVRGGAVPSGWCSPTVGTPVFLLRPRVGPAARGGGGGSDLLVEPIERWKAHAEVAIT
jgi:hypothetical protein